MTDEVHPVLKYVRCSMGNTWRQDDHLLDKLFPLEPEPSPQYLEARKNLFNEDSRYKRWKGISTLPKPMSRIYTPLTRLLNEILAYHGVSRHERLFLNTHVRRRSSRVIRPGIWLSGVGSEFASTSLTRPRAHWISCISALEVVLDSDDFIAARDRLAVHIHQLFQKQDNRRFAFGLVITQHVFTVFMFDHSGAVASKPCNYHTHPDQFCAVISGIAGKGDRIGLDHTMFSEGGLTKVRTFQAGEGESEVETIYIIKEGIFGFPSLNGRGTLCWLASREDDAESKFVIKDAWIAPSDTPGRESEAFLLRHAHSEGVINGVVQIHHFEEVRRSADPSDLDTVLRNRQVGEGSPEDLKVERVHTRMVISPYGKTLDHFATREELLFAFHDAVLAHRKLHDVAGILHRDISVRNILINPAGAEGNRGILIDFDHAIRTSNTSPYSTKNHMGTRRYMSVNVLDASGPHTYLDDLESFYYVLCWLLVAYKRPGIPMKELPDLLKHWDGEGSSIFKTGAFGYNFEYPVAPWFGRSLHQLIVQLHHFFSFRLRRKFASDPAKDYDEFLAHIHHAIDSLEKECLDEGTVTPTTQETSTESEVTTSSSREGGRDVTSDEKFSSSSSNRPRHSTRNPRRVARTVSKRRA